MNRWGFLTFVLVACMLTSCDSDPVLNQTAVTLKPFSSCDEMQRATEVGHHIYDDVAVGSSSAASGDSVEDASGGVLGETNVQTEGVDELDTAKADGNFIYRIHNTEDLESYEIASAVQVLRRAPTGDASIVQSITLDGLAEGLFLLPGELIALSSNYDYPNSSVELSYFNRKTDGRLELTNSRKLRGNVRTARLIGDRLHLVMVNYMQSKAEDMLPTTTYQEEDRQLRRCDEVLHEPALFEGLSYVPYVGSLFCIMTLNTSQKDVDPQSECVAAEHSSVVYASKENLYLSTSGWNDKGPIHQFALGNSQRKTKYIGSVLLEGNLLNSFAMDEYQGYLRVAASIGFNGSNEVSVFKLTDGDPQQVAKIDNIAPGESIYAVRFVGEVGYVVTFKKVDPLFTIDLSNPKDPSIRGELKIPGFSTYLHPMQPGYLLAIGKQAEEAVEGDFAWFQGVALTIFDVRDLDDPRQVQKIAIGGRGTNSEALNDHKAFRYIPEENLVVVPMDLYSESGGQSQFGEYLHSSFQIYRVTVENGFELVGESVFSDVGAGYWWSHIQQGSRSFYRDGILSLVGGSEFVLREAAAPDTDLVRIALD